jgi:ATP-dependent RNA helicase SUPV3L1/SUV3
MPAGSTIKAVLGPTNTGKTHLAVERLVAHSSGIMGFPLRLLAREIYDRVVAIKGPKEVGLITGEERIMPPGARWILCTTESMPTERDVAFVALDEAQLGADMERGHVFTDRLLSARGREETMILGADTLKPVLRALVPDAEIVARPRFSTLSYAGAKKLSRLPKRSAIVAFSAEDVYAVAEMLRRTRGGAAVVMGALSPRTRNAQVAMYQAGEVDYLVATDAIGMGLNMDVHHVAFASLSKFDGRRQRRLTLAEMAQIAGRAGRHQRDGTFGTLGSPEGPGAFLPEEIERIENHQFQRLDWLYWRDSDLDFQSIDALLASLDVKPHHPVLRAAPQATDMAVLKLLADDPAIADRARSSARVARLWSVCGLPDFRKVGPEHHARTIARLFRHLTEGNGTVPAPVFADEIARLDRVEGDIDAIGARIAAARTWAYVAHRPDWLDDPAHWANACEALEERLSDALHKRLTERFVDRRTAVLMRSIGDDPALLDVSVGDDGGVSVDGETIGRIDGFAFSVDPATRTGDRKLLLAAAERHLPKERIRRVKALIAAPDSDFAIDDGHLRWQSDAMAKVATGKRLALPILLPDRSFDTLSHADKLSVLNRLQTWLDGHVRRHLAALIAIDAALHDLHTPSPVRAILAPLVASGGIVARSEIEIQLAALTGDHRRVLRRSGLTIGTLDVFDARLIKPEALRLVALLLNHSMPRFGATVITGKAHGFRPFGAKAVRVDLVERIARALHARRKAESFVPDPALATSFGVDAATFSALLRDLGFRADVEGRWHWRHKVQSRPDRRPLSPAFAALEAWRG